MELTIRSQPQIRQKGIRNRLDQIAPINLQRKKHNTL